MNVPRVYSALGYPKITYNANNIRYVAPEPNFTLTYHTPSVYLHIGSLSAPVIGLARAVELAAKNAKLDPLDYTLAEADYVSGDVVNGSLSNDPSWLVFFAESHDGYWVFGGCGSGSFSVFADVDALTGAVSKSSYCTGPSLPVTGSFRLSVDSAKALQSVRSSNLSGVPTAVTENGIVNSMEARIVLFGPSSNNLSFENPLNTSYSGSYRLSWVIQMFSSTPQFGYQGIFAVDAETGELLSGWAYPIFPSSHCICVDNSIVFASANNLAVSAETFEIDGAVVGVSGSVPVTVPNVVIAKPGSTGTLELNLSSELDTDASLTFSFINPLPSYQAFLSDGVPRGVSIQTSSKVITIPSNGQAKVTISISVDGSALSGTYLIELKATFSGPQSVQPGESRVFFFLSVWNGSGPWPAPPNPA